MSFFFFLFFLDLSSYSHLLRYLPLLLFRSREIAGPDFDSISLTSSFWPKFAVIAEDMWCTPSSWLPCHVFRSSLHITLSVQPASLDYGSRSLISLSVQQLIVREWLFCDIGVFVFILTSSFKGLSDRLTLYVCSHIIAASRQAGHLTLSFSSSLPSWLLAFHIRCMVLRIFASKRDLSPFHVIDLIGCCCSISSSFLFVPYP